MLKNIFKSQIIFIVLISVIVGGLSGVVSSIFTSSISSGYIAPSMMWGWGSKKAIQKEENNNIQINEETGTIDAVKKVAPSVVSIVISKDVSKYYNSTGEFPFNSFFDIPGFNIQLPREQQQNSKPQMQEVGGGTGFIISADGLILTNKHVVSDSEAEYTVITNDGKKYPAKVLATDTVNDIGVVKIEAKDLVPVELGDSADLKIGQTVIAIGNALGEYRNTVTKGVVSGLARKVSAGDGQGFSETIEEAIQTDAAINPGNSGGPLINLAGQVIGIDTAVSRQGQLVGFAIPINTAKQVIESVKKYGRIIRPFLGVRYVPITKEIADANNLKVDYGALVLRGKSETDLAVIPGSPADKAGIVENDIILQIGGQKIDENHSLVDLVSKYKPGDEVEFKILHKGEEKKVKVKLEERK